MNYHVSGRAHQIDAFRSLTTIDASRKDSAFRQVARQDVEIAGSGDVVASELIADRAHLWIAGSASATMPPRCGTPCDRMCPGGSDAVAP